MATDLRRSLVLTLIGTAATLAVGAALLAAAVPAGADHRVETSRITGADRYETAARIAQLGHPSGADVAMVANGQRFSDALAATALARMAEGPVLLTQRDVVPAATRTALRDMGIDEVRILGGTAAVSARAEAALEDTVDEVSRLVGDTRFETAAGIARAIDSSGAIGRMEGHTTAILVNGYAFADAVAAGPLAASQTTPFPILMTERDRLPASTERVLGELDVQRAVIVGGPAVVSDDVDTRLRQLGYQTTRLAGADRSETSSRVADHGTLIGAFDTERVHLARGDEPADALAAGPLAGQIASPILLTPGPQQVGATLQEWLGAECPGISRVRAVGGPAAVSASALDGAARGAARCHERVPSQYQGAEVSWVAPWGSDLGAGSAEDPFASIERGMREMDPGETLVVRGGTYRERIALSFSAVTPARPDAPITVEAYPGERPVIEGRLRLSGADHWTIRGINVTWSPANASNEHMVHFRAGTGWRFTDAEVWGARSFSAILVNDGARDFLLDHLYVHHTHPTNGTNQDHLLYIGSGNHGGVIERNVLAHSPNGRGVKIGPGSLSQPGSDWITIRYNTFYANTGPSNVRISGASSNNEIYGNLLVRPAERTAAVSSYELTGHGNVARDNAAWETSAVVRTAPGLADRGGNIIVDPLLTDPANGDFRPRSARAAEYGAHAPASAQED